MVQTTKKDARGACPSTSRLCRPSEYVLKELGGPDACPERDCLPV